ncbi:MAG: ATP-binding protein, partial [Dehalococcoidia bacterium]|nr:ATP-binding protein [Dehalococcoidia bacterium]
MESLEEILKKIPRNISAGSSATSSSDEPGSPPPDPNSAACPKCRGIGFVRVDVPVGDPDFGKALPCDCRLRDVAEHIVGRLEKLSNLGPLARLTFEKFRPDGLSSDPVRQARARQAYSTALAYAEKPDGWLILTGSSGCGKTHLTAAIMNRCIAQGRSAYFTVVADLLDHLRASFAPTSDITYDQLFDYIRNVPILALDDLGMYSSTPWAQEKLFQIINYRYNCQLPTICTTTAALSELDERLRTRLTDPALSKVLVVEEPAPLLLQRMGGLILEFLGRMTFDTFDPKRLNLGRDQQQNLEHAFETARTFADNPEGWLVLQGPIGCGKTHLAAAIANHRRSLNQQAFFVVVPDLLDHLRSTFSPESKVTYDTVFESVRTASLLILDDLGTQTSTPWAQEKLYQIINYRYNAQLPTVITTNSSLEEIDGRLSSRMADPQLSLVFAITAPDFRVDARP